MTDTSVSSGGIAHEGLTAGQILQKARQAQGLQLADLAASMKVLPRKLELLEADRHEELLDPTFARALAQAVCRNLKIDPAPVLARLPKAEGMPLEKQQPGLNTPFHERPSKSTRHDTKSRGPGLLLQVWLPVLLIVGAAFIYFTPVEFRVWESASPTQAPVSDPAPEVTAITEAAREMPADAASDAAPAASEPALPEPVASVPEPSTSPAAPELAAVAAAPLLELQVRKGSWIEVRDGSGLRLLARHVEAQESVALNGSLPLKLKIGNASHTTVRFRGELIDLRPSTRDNVARLELK